MLIAFVIVVGIVCVALAIFILGRPTPPKKYPIFNLSNSIEDRFNNVMGQVRAVANDSLSLYTTYNQTAFEQLVDGINTKLENLVSEIDKFDSYWQKYARYKAQASFVSVCRSYSETRRNQISSAKGFMKDAIPITRVTNSMKELKQNAFGVILTTDGVGRFIPTIHGQTSTLLLSVQKLQPQHPVAQQYTNYIIEFLTNQIQHLDTCLKGSQESSDELLMLFNRYMDTWSNFNDTHVVDLINDEFSWQIDSHQQAMDELRQNTDYNE